MPTIRLYTLVPNPQKHYLNDMSRLHIYLDTTELYIGFGVQKWRMRICRSIIGEPFSLKVLTIKSLGVSLIKFCGKVVKSVEKS